LIDRDGRKNNTISIAKRVAGTSRRYVGRTDHQADEYMAVIAAERVVRHLERAGFVMKRPPDVDGPALGRGFQG
jgi:hypothetical protein